MNPVGEPIDKQMQQWYSDFQKITGSHTPELSKNEVATFIKNFESKLIESRDSIYKIKDKKLTVLRGYSKTDLNNTIVFLENLVVWQSLKQENWKQGTIKKKYISDDGNVTIIQDDQRSYPRSVFRKALHHLLESQKTAKKPKAAIKAQYHDQFKDAAKETKKIFGELGSFERDALKPTFDAAIKVLEYYHNKYKS